MIRGHKPVEPLELLALWDLEHPPPRIPFEPVEPPPATPTGRRRSWRRRAALTLAYTTLFFAGGAVVAGAGNQLAQVDAESTDPAVVTDTTTTDTTSTDTTSTETATATTDTTTTTADVTTATETTAADTTTDAAPAPAADPSDATPPHVADAGTPTATAPAKQPAPARVVVAAHVSKRAATSHVPSGPSPFPVLAFNPQVWLVAHPGTPAGDAAVAIAEQYLGVPYRWGGNTPSAGFDCSGLTQYVYAQLGVWLPHYAAAQFLAYPRVDPTRLQPGDLVFFEPKADGPGHVAIYAGGDTIVEAPYTGADVRLGSLPSAAASLGFLGAVRPSAGATATPTLQTFALLGTPSPPANWLSRAN